jgi:hypothetical protein
MPCSLLKGKLRIGGTFRLHLQGRMQSSAYTCFHAGFLLGLFFDPEYNSLTESHAPNITHK